MFGNKDKKYHDVVNFVVNELKAIMEDIQKKKLLSVGDVRERFEKLNDIINKNAGVTKNTVVKEKITAVLQGFQGGAFTSTEDCYTQIQHVINALNKELDSQKAS